MSDLDVLRTLRDQIVPPPLDTLRETARRRGRAASAAGALAAAAAVAVVATTTVLAVGGDDDGSLPPVETPDPGSSTRPLTYADGDVLHYGERTIDADGPIVELDLTDQGVAFRTDDKRIWFTDGTGVEEIGDVGEPGPAYTRGDVWPLLVHDGWVVSAHSGSLVAWFEFAGPGGRPVAVVYDASTREVLARERVTADLERVALPYLVSDRYFYWFAEPDPEVEAIDTPQVRLDPQTGDIVPVSDEQVQDDLRSQGLSRTILIGARQGGRRSAPGHRRHGSQLRVLRWPDHAPGWPALVRRGRRDREAAGVRRPARLPRHEPHLADAVARRRHRGLRLDGRQGRGPARVPACDRRVRGRAVGTGVAGAARDRLNGATISGGDSVLEGMGETAGPGGSA